MGIGDLRTRTHDYKRHGTITLFAALNYLDGKLIARLEARHTHVEWLRFLKQIDRETPKDLSLHLTSALPVSDIQSVTFNLVGGTQVALDKLFRRDFQLIAVLVHHGVLPCVQPKAVTVNFIGAACQDGNTER